MEKLYLWHRFNYVFVLFVHAWLTILHNIAILVNDLCAAVIFFFFLPVAMHGHEPSRGKKAAAGDSNSSGIIADKGALANRVKVALIRTDVV